MSQPSGPDVGVHWRRPDADLAFGPTVPGPRDIDRAAVLIRETEPPSPLVMSGALSRRYSRSVYLKLESLSPIRSFKHRGALTAVDRIRREHGDVGVVTASTGNHGQGVAYAGRRAGIETTVLAPRDALAEKLDAMRALGAEVEIWGETLAEAQQRAAAIAAERGWVYLEDGEDPALMAGAATVMREILDQLPGVGSVIVPVGGGNLIAGCLLALEQSEPAPAIVGVQSAAAPSATDSWLAGAVRERPCRTFAGGLATDRPGTLALDVMTRRLETMVLVTESDLHSAIALGVLEAGCLMEGAAAAPLAALETRGGEIPGDPLVLVVTGSWLSPRQLADAFDR